MTLFDIQNTLLDAAAAEAVHPFSTASTVELLRSLVDQINEHLFDSPYFENEHAC